MRFWQLSGIAAALASGAILAQSGKMPPFSEIDRNGDGKLTLEEVKNIDDPRIDEAFYRQADIGKLTENDNVSRFEYENQVRKMQDSGQGQARSGGHNDGQS